MDNLWIIYWSGWWFFALPLCKIWVGQLGWLFPTEWKIKKCSKPPASEPVMIFPYKKRDPPLPIVAGSTGRIESHFFAVVNHHPVGNICVAEKKHVLLIKPFNVLQIQCVLFLCTYIYICTCVCIYIYIYILYTYMYVYVYRYIYIYHTYINIYIYI